MNEIDKNLYSRQIFTYGQDLMEKIVNLKILIIGLRGLGIEIAKNLILAGPKEVLISDKNKCQINDLNSNFYINEDDIDNKIREEACLEKLSLLNKYVEVLIYKGNFREDLNRFNLIIITEIMKIEELYEINEICRQNNIYFIYTLNLGLTGFIFNDFGDNHFVYDINGEKNLEYHIFNIVRKDNKYEIFVDIQKNEFFYLEEGNFVIFKDVKGLEFLNDNIPKKIIRTTNNSFEIESDYKNNNKYIEGGIIEEIKIPKHLKFNSFKYNLINPNNNFITLDKSKKNANILLQCSFVGLHKYFSMKGVLPELNNLEKVNEIVELSYQYYLEIKEKNIELLKNKKNKNKIIEFDKTFIENAIKWAKAEINPICCFLGGIVSQEAIKITGKYMPIYQWLRFDFFETINNIPNSCNRSLLNSRYDDQISIFGQEIQEKLKSLNIFMIGAGALGCEFLKNFALMGIAVDNEKKNNIIVTDNDNIVISNLNRQFLFKNNDIGKNKAFCACREAKKINKDINLINQNTLVCDDSRDIYDDIFWEKQNLIISAVDNITARKYIDNLCTFYNKMFIDSGTEGTKANSDIYYPDKTICLNDINFNTKEKIPMCTLKNFPTEIEHCIEYGKIIFTELFNLNIKEIKMTEEDENKFYNILSETINNDDLCIKLEMLKYIYHIIDKQTPDLIISFEIFIFKLYFEYNINKVLKEQQEAFLNPYNKKPSPIKIDLEDEDNCLFFKSFYYILCNVLNFESNITYNEIKLLVNQIDININFDKLEREELINKFKNEIINKINNNINNIKEKIKLIKPIIFEKDDDNNNQINFILSFSNLRANNYNIQKCDFLKAKEVAGNIIPAIASTTAAITGLCCLQIYTLLQTDNIRLLRSGAINLATNEYDLSIPEEKRYIQDKAKTEKTPEYKVIPKEFTVWDKIDLIGPNLTVKTIVDDFKNKYNVDIDFINYSNDILSSPFEEDEDLNKTIEELIIGKTGKKISDKTKYIKLNINASMGNCEILTPTIRYILKK